MSEYYKYGVISEQGLVIDNRISTSTDPFETLQNFDLWYEIKNCIKRNKKFLKSIVIRARFIEFLIAKSENPESGSECMIFKKR